MRAAPGHQSACGHKPPQHHTSFSPGTARPLRVTRRRRSRQNKSGESVRTRFAADLCSGCTLGSTSFLCSISPLPSGYPPHFYYRKRGHNFNHIPLHQALSFILPDGVLFAQNKRIFSHASYPKRLFPALSCRSSAQPLPPDTGTKRRTHAWGLGLSKIVDSEASDGLWRLVWGKLTSKFTVPFKS